MNVDQAARPAPSPDQRPAHDASISAKNTGSALAVGCGFALAFGWVWSGALRGLLFSGVLTGSLFSGQGSSVFFAVLMAVFALGGVFTFALGLAAPGTGAPRMRPPGWLFALVAHGAALLPLCASYLYPGSESTLAVAASLGLAGGLAGLYWGGALLRLAPAAAGLALLTAWLLITGLVLLLIRLPEFVPTPFPPPAAMLPACALVALFLAWGLASRPMPPELSGRETPRPAQLPKITAAAMFLAVAALGALFSADGYAPPAVVAQCGLEAGGALLALAVFRVAPGRSSDRRNASQGVRLFASLALPLALPLALLPLAAFRAPVFSWSLHLVTGTLLAVIAMRLAGPSPLQDGITPGLASRAPRAGLSLAALLLALNAGFFTGTRVAVVWGQDNTGLAAFLCACLAVLYVLVHFGFRRPGGWAGSKDGAARREDSSADLPAAMRAKREPEHGALSDALAPGDAPGTDTGTAGLPEEDKATAPPKEPAQATSEPPASLTPTEQRIAALLRQGYNNNAISDALDIAQATTRVHLRSIHKKMGTATREELVARLQGVEISI